MRLIAFAIAIGICVGQQFAIRHLSLHNAMLAADYQDCIASNNHTTRSRTSYKFPRMGSDELQAITETAQALAWPWELIAAAEKLENGGMTLELGAQLIPQDIQNHYPPYMWQRATGARIMAQEAGRMIIEDPEVTYLFANRLAKRWKSADPSHWRDEFISCLNHWRGEGQAARPSKPNKHKKAARRNRR